VAAVLLFVTTQLLPHEKKAELLECGIAFLLFLVIAFPVNREDFTRPKGK
jgi:mannitol-specific phosphotransferase system IIBC component